MIKHLIIATCALAAMMPAQARETNMMQRTDSRACERWVDSVYNSMTERERVAQLIFPKVVPALSQSSKANIKRLVGDNQVGGLLYTSGSLKQYIEITNYAQSLAKVPVLMTFDGEWGLAMRIGDTPKYPCNMALGAIDDTALMRRYGREMAREMKLTGLHVNFAPDIDVNSNPRNPVIGYRSFGEDPNRVAKLGTAYALGLEDCGIQAVGKHFPGHGDTNTDSHKERTIVNHSLDQLNNIDLLPFKDYINAGLSGVMTGHIVVPVLDNSERPASLSYKMTTELLRKQLGFEGLIYTDAIEMKGAKYKNVNRSVEALKAGADVLESMHNPVETIDAIMAEVKAGRISKALIEDRCKRVLRYKYAMGLNTRPQPIKLDGLSGQINSAEAQAVKNALAQACITVLRNEGNLLPLGQLASRRIAVVNIGEGKNNEFADVCRRYTDVDVYYTNGEAFSEASLAKIRNHDVVVAAVYNDKAESMRVYGQLADMPSLVSVFIMNPYKMDKFHSAISKTKALVLAYDNLPETRAAAAMALFGGIEVTGKLPVNLGHTGKLGDGIHLPKTRLGYTSPIAEGFNPALADSLDLICNRAVEMAPHPGARFLLPATAMWCMKRHSASSRPMATAPAATPSTTLRRYRRLPAPFPA